jgi:hypothetical protein
MKRNGLSGEFLRFVAEPLSVEDVYGFYWGT